MDQRSAAERGEKPTFPAAEGGSVVGYLPAGILIWGGLGKLLDSWLNTQFFTPAGLVIGSVLAMYLVYLYFVRRPVSAPDWVGVGTGPNRSEEEGPR